MNIRLIFEKTVVLLIVFNLCFSPAFFTQSAYSQGQDPYYMQLRQIYSNAADAADDAAESSETLTYIWGGVAVVCLGLCIASLAGSGLISGGGDKYICMIASMGAGIAEMIMTKNVQNSMMSILAPPMIVAAGNYSGSNKPKDSPATAAATAGGVGSAKPSVVTSTGVYESRKAVVIPTLKGGTVESQGPIRDTIIGTLPRQLPDIRSFGIPSGDTFAGGVTSPGGLDFSGHVPPAETPTNTASVPEPPDSSKFPGSNSQGAPKTESTTNKPPEKGESKDIACCLTAAMALIQTFMKYQSAQEQRDSAEENRDKVTQLDASYRQQQQMKAMQAKRKSSAATAAATANSDSNSDSNGNSQQKTVQSAGYAVSGLKPMAATAAANTNALYKSTQNCSLSRKNTNTNSLLSCAIANEPRLPKIITTPYFQGLFAKVTHQNFGDFIRNSHSSPAEAVAEALRPKIGLQKSYKLANYLTNLNKEIALKYQNQQPTTPTLMKDIAKNLTPTGQTEAQLPAFGKTTIAAIGNTNENYLFYNKTSSRYLYRSPDSIAEDKSINLFDRVSSRYELFYRKILLSK